MTITVGGTAITFNDGTTQSTAGGAVNTTSVLNATAGLSAGAVGTYAIGYYTPGSQTVFGSNYATIRTWNGMAGSGDTVRGGTWKSLGFASGWAFACNTYYFYLFVRVA